MQPSSPIYFLDMPFAENGDKTIIPAEEATADGRATQSEGFPEITQQPIASGGIAPNRWDFNGMFFLLSQFAHWEQSGGQATWNSELGYTPPSIVYYNKVYYVCITESGPETDAGAITPGTNSDYWVTLWDYLSDGQSFVKNGDTVTLTGDTTGSGTFDDDGNVSIATTTTTAAKLGGSTVGGIARGIYLDSGTAKAMSATVGSGTKPVYLSSGTVTVSSSTVGTSAKPVYLSSGEIKASTSDIGSGVKPVYMSSGAITASSSTVGSGKKPVYLSSGTITESSSTVGDSSTPVYLNSGTFTECSLDGMGMIKSDYIVAGTIGSSDTVKTITLPSEGTWFYWVAKSRYKQGVFALMTGTAAGGTVIDPTTSGWYSTPRAVYFAIRVS